MGERRVLVVGSQCEALQGSTLSFLPRAADDLARTLTDPVLGGWVPALKGELVLTDPTIDELDNAVAEVVTRASQDAATLLLAYIGHGDNAGHDFYLLPRDAVREPLQWKTAYRLATRLAELLKIHSGLDGLVLLVDACHSGVAAREAAATWTDTIAQARGRFEILTSADERDAADGCFTARLVELLRRGDRQQGAYLHCDGLRAGVQAICTRQRAIRVAFDGRQFTSVGDPGLWLGRNPARAPLAGTPAWGQVERLTAWFERTPQLDQLVDTAQTARCVALVGDAGQGKSTLAAALARADLDEDLLPKRYTHALAFAAPATTTDNLARALAEQLAVTVDGFADTAEAFQRQTPQEELARLGQMERQVIRPLALLPDKRPGRRVRLVIDGLDQLSAQAAPAVHDALVVLAGDPALARVRLIVTARPDTSLPPGATRLEAGRVSREDLESYLRRRKVPTEAVAVIITRADGNWLVASLLADLATDGRLPAAELPGTLAEKLAEAYRQELRRAGADDPARWASRLRPILAVLAAAGVGPVLPLALLCAASGGLGGPDHPARARDVLVTLRGLVVRGAPGTPEEHDGVFHATLAEFLLADPALGIDPAQAHAALADAIDQLAPRSDHNPADPLHRYAAAAEAEHLWVAGRIEAALDALKARASHVPAENRERWAAWAARLDAKLGAEHPATLRARHEFAHWTAQAGEFREALQLLHEVLDVRRRVLPKDDPDTLNTRHGVAYWTGRIGDHHEALRLLREVLAAKERVLSADHGSILVTRHDIAFFTAQAGEHHEALRLLREVLRDRARVLGPDHRSTLTTRHTLAYVLQQLGQYEEAEAEYRAILEVQQRIFGDDHPQILGTRHNLASLLHQRGHRAEAQAAYQAVLDRRRRVLGDDHPDTLTTRHALAYVLQELGRYPEAEAEYRAILVVQQRELGDGNPETLGTRHALARLRQEQGDYAQARVQLEEVLELRRRVLGDDNPDTLDTRHTLTFVLQQLGKYDEAEAEYRAILEVQLRVLGDDNPYTLATRHNLARLRQERGDFAEARRQLEEVLERRRRVLGDDHPDTLDTRHTRAYVLQELGHYSEAEYRAILEAQLRVLGDDHPQTLATRHALARLRQEQGDFAEARRQLEEVLERRRRVLGDDHLDTLTTRHTRAYVLHQLGEYDEAEAEYRAILEVQQRIFPDDHPQILGTRHNLASLLHQRGHRGVSGSQ